MSNACSNPGCPDIKIIVKATVIMQPARENEECEKKREKKKGEKSSSLRVG